MPPGETRFREVSVFLHATCSFFFREFAFFYRFWVFVRIFFLLFFSFVFMWRKCGEYLTDWIDLIQFLTIRASPPPPLFAPFSYCSVVIEGWNEAAYTIPDNQPYTLHYKA